MRSGLGLSGILLFSLSGSSLVTGCNTKSSDFETFMRIPLPSNVEIIKMDGNWGNDPWRCWEISPVDDGLKRTLIAKWNLIPNLNCGSPKDRPHVVGAISGDSDRSATGIFDAHPNRISDAER